MIEIKELSYQVRDRQILSQIEMHIKKQEFVGIIGPNGSGKSTLLKNIYKVLKPQEGSIFLMGEDLTAISNREMAEKLSVLIQEQESSFDFTVEEVVMMGRHARKKMLESEDKTDKKKSTRNLKKDRTPFHKQSEFSHPLRRRKTKSPDSPRIRPGHTLPDPGRAHKPPGHQIPARTNESGKSPKQNRNSRNPRPKHSRTLLHLHIRPKKRPNSSPRPAPGSPDRKNNPRSIRSTRNPIHRPNQPKTHPIPPPVDVKHLSANSLQSATPTAVPPPRESSFPPG